jgi:hypothetical protein
MTAISITPGYPTFADTDGSSLNDGYVYIGLENQNPITAPAGAFWDKEFQVPANQPLRTSGGYIVRNGTPAAVYTGASYSILVQNKNLVTVYNAPSAVITNVTNNVEEITQYQGAHAVDPIVRNDGTPLEVGDLYFNTVINELKVWTGTDWVSASPGAITVQNFTGTGAQTAFNLASSPVAENNTQIYIDGVYQQKDTYTLSGATINFSTAPPYLSGIEVVTFSIASLGTVDASNVSYNRDNLGTLTTVAEELDRTTTINVTAYELGTTAAVSAHAGIATGYIIRTNYFDSARTSGSGAEYSFTGVTTLGKAGNWPDADGYFYDADGKQFESVDLNEDRNADKWGGTFLPTLSSMRSGGEFQLLNAFSKTVAAELTAATNTDDQSDIINEVLSDAVSIHIGPSLIYCGELVPQSQTKITGAGYGSYTVNVLGNTALRGVIGKTTVFDITNKTNVQLYDFTIDGRSNTLDGIVSTGGSSHLEVSCVKFLDCANGILGDGADPFSSRILGSVFRQGGTGIKNVLDSLIHQCVFSGNARGMYVANGQIQILNSFFEFQRNGALAGDAISLIGNANEITIMGNKFDRNSGHDISAVSAGGNFPRGIIVVGNQFKGAAWGTDITKANRVSIWGQSGCFNDSVITGNYFQQRGHEPSAIEGIVSPLGAIYLPGNTNFVIGPNSDTTKNYIDNTLVGWELSASGTNEYYYGKAGGSDIAEPDYAWEGTSQMTAGTAGALAANAWDWADNDSLGYSTIYVRLTSGLDPDTAVMRFSYNTSMSTQNSHLFGSGSGTITNGSSASYDITVDQTTVNTGRAFVIEVFGDETSTTATFSYEFNIVTDRGSAGAAAVDEGLIIDRKAGLSSRGWTSGGLLEDLTVAVTSRFGGRILTVTLTNNGGNSLRTFTRVRRN